MKYEMFQAIAEARREEREARWRCDVCGENVDNCPHANEEHGRIERKLDLVNDWIDRQEAPGEIDRDVFRGELRLELVQLLDELRERFEEQAREQTVNSSRVRWQHKARGIAEATEVVKTGRLPDER